MPKKKSPERRRQASLHVAETILQQLGGVGQLQAMIGAKNFVGDEHMVQFKWSARAKGGVNTVVISLEPTDTYRVEFYKLRGHDTKLVDSHSGVYADGLVRLFESTTGLYIRL